MAGIASVPEQSHMWLQPHQQKGNPPVKYTSLYQPAVHCVLLSISSLHSAVHSTLADISPSYSFKSDVHFTLITLLSIFHPVLMSISLVRFTLLIITPAVHSTTAIHFTLLSVSPCCPFHLAVRFTLLSVSPCCPFQWLVTAAHCLTSIPMAGTYTVVLGMHYKNSER